MLLVGTLLAAMIAYLPGFVVSATVAGRWAVLSVGVAAMLLFMRGRPLLGPGHTWALLLFIWAGLAVFWSVSPYDSLGEMYHWLVLGVLFLASSQYRNSPEVLLTALVMGLCLSVPFVLLQIQGQVPVEVTDIPGGLFLSRNTLGEISAVLLVWALARRSWGLIPAPLLMVALSTSRGAALAVAVGLAFDKKLWPLAVGLGCLAGFAVFTGSGNISSSLLRLEILQVTITNLTVFGHGLETFGTMAPNHGFVHNDGLQLVFELGLGALLAVPLFLRVAILGAALPEARAFLALAGASLVSFPLHHPVGAALMAVLSGYCCGVRDRDERAKSVLRASNSLGVYRPSPAKSLRHTSSRGTNLAL